MGHKLITSLIVVAALAMQSLSPANAEDQFSGCEPNSAWATMQPKECILEYSEESRVISGIRFPYTFYSCKNSFGVGTDSIPYIRFPEIKENGIAVSGRSYRAEIYLSHNCLSLQDPYLLDFKFFNSATGEVLLSKVDSAYWLATKSDYLLKDASNFCWLTKCGGTNYRLTIQVPISSEPGKYSVQVRVRGNAKYPNAAPDWNFDVTLNYRNPITISRPSIPVFQSCKMLWKTHPNGIASKSTSKNKGAKITRKPKVDYLLYVTNSKLDHDKDGLICER